MSTVSLEDNEWNYVLGVLGDRPWRETNSVLMKIGTQLRMQQQQAVPNAQEQKQREREHPQAASRGVSSPPGNSDWIERGPQSGAGKTEGAS
jgi:hypothetical protein